MRKEWRNALFSLILLINGATVASAQHDSEKRAVSAPAECVRLAVEVTWSLSKADPAPSRATTSPKDKSSGEPEFTLAVTSGRVLDVLDWPAGNAKHGSLARMGNLSPDPQGSWNLGTATEGRVRARIEAPIDASLVLRGGDQAIGMPLAAVLERPQRTPPQSRLVVSVERLPWDSIIIDLGDSVRDGIVAPGATVPMSVGFNIIWPEASEVSVRTSAVLRPQAGGDILWRDEPREVIPANLAEPPTRIWNVRAPRAEGTYVLEVRATWESAAGHEGSRLARLIRRRRPGAVTSSAVRRVAFTVVDPDARVGAISLDASRARPKLIQSIFLDHAATDRSPLDGQPLREQDARSGRYPPKHSSSPHGVSAFGAGSSATAVRPPNSTLPTPAAWHGQPSASR